MHLYSWSCTVKIAFFYTLLYIICLHIAPLMLENPFLVTQINSFFAKKYKQMDEQLHCSKNLILHIKSLRSFDQQSKDDQFEKTLLKYHGEPTIREYLQKTHGIPQGTYLEAQSTVNRNMRRLKRSHLPKLFYLYQKLISNYEIKQVELVNQEKYTEQQCPIKFLQQSRKEEPIIKLVNEKDTSTCLTSAQTIVFAKITFQKFKNIFDQRDLLNILKKINTQNENRNSNNRFLNSKFKGDSIINVIFQLFCLPGLNFILWPSIILQPIVGSKQTIKSIINSKNTYKKGQENNNEQRIFESTLHQYLINIAHTKNSSSIYKPSKQQDILLTSILEQTSANHNTEEFIVKLIGTNATIIEKEVVFQWKKFDTCKLNLLIFKTPFEHLVKQINRTICIFNQFKKHQRSQVNGKECLFKICKYRVHGREHACIPVRLTMGTQQNILVKHLGQFRQQDASQCRWISKERLTINHTLPQHYSQQRKFYYLFTENFSIQEALEFIYSNYFNRSIGYLQVLKRIFPEQQIFRNLERSQRCQKCHYLVRKTDDFVSCKNCICKYHASCANQSKRNNKKYCKNIYETDNEEDVWSCQTCKPCKVCYSAIRVIQDSLKCTICNQTYHFDCGKLINVNMNELDTQANFACQSCLKCALCRISLKQKQYFTKLQNILCSICLYEEQKRFCYVCQGKIEDTSYIQCKNPLCGAQRHKKCESKQENGFLDMKDYKCEMCRMGEKRKIMRWILQEVKLFDEYEYFDDPYYETISGYQEIIKHPMCFELMRSRIMSGQYDNSAYEEFCKDIELIAKNAMTFNMPREEVHFRAKLLLIVSFQFLKMFKDLLYLSEFQIMTKQLEKMLLNRRESFYKDLYKNFAKYLLNFGKQTPRIEVIASQQNRTNESIFSSRYIFSKTLMNSQLKYHFQTTTETIEQLFKMPKLVISSWGKTTQNYCYYHPKYKQPIIFRCNICWEQYCCTTVCYKHSYCRICKKFGCACNEHACVCHDLREKQYKTLQKEIRGFLIENSITKLEYTQYHKLCLKCAKTLNRICYVCKSFCYFGYEICQDCTCVYHIHCQKKSRIRQSFLYKNKFKLAEIYDFIKLNNKCRVCSIKRNMLLYKKPLQQAAQKVRRRLHKIQENIHILQNIYEKNGIRLTKSQIMSLIYTYFDEYQSKLAQFDELSKFFKSNIITISQEQQNLNVQNSEMRLLTQQKTQVYPRKIYYQKWVAQQMKKLETGCRIRQLGYTSSHYSSFLREEMVAEKIESKKKSLYQRKKQMKYIYFEYQLQKDMTFEETKQKAILQLDQNNRLNYKEKFNFTNFSTAMEYVRENTPQLLEVQQFQKYLRYKYFNEPHQPANITAYQKYNLLFQPFQDEVIKINFKKTKCIPYEFPLPKKIQLLYEYISNFALRKFEDDKLVLMKGNTYLLITDEKHWKVRKNFGNKIFQIQLFKEANRQRWILKINEERFRVNEILDICQALKKVGPKINNFEELYHFLGFSLTDTTFNKPKHFKTLLQHKNFYEISRKQRKQQVERIYDTFLWHKNGIFEQKQSKKVYKVQKSNIFYLNKRNMPQTQLQAEKEQEQKVNKQLITLQDLKRQLFPKDNYFQGHIQDQPRISHIPINDVYIAPSRIDRLGLFIGKDVPKYTTIIEYVGEIVSEMVANLRQKIYKDGCYLFTLGQDQNNKLEIIDATRYGNKARYLNHSCDPNCKAKVVKVGQKNRIMIYTIKNVKKDEELTYDYQFKIQLTERLECKCGSNICQGRLN